jgi:site-specific DNA-methyltransferase (cytosine-N4-specific)
MPPTAFHTTDHGTIFQGDSLELLHQVLRPGSVDLVMTSPPFGLVRKKEYGNAPADDYLEWFRPFAEALRLVLKENGSLVIDIGGAWVPGQPTRSLYHFKLLIMLVEEFGFHLAQEFFWWNPSKLPSPAEWVTVRRIRVKDAVNCVWWLSPSPWPRADNRRVLQPYSPSMQSLLKNGYRAKKRPSGHDISTNFARNNGAAIPPNLIALAHTESNTHYLRYCQEHGITPHPARYPAELPEYFIRMLTEAGDLVVDPFGGSCVTGEVCERLGRRWACCELQEEYVRGAIGRFAKPMEPRQAKNPADEGFYYRAARPDILWNGEPGDPLPIDGGKNRPKKKQMEVQAGTPVDGGGEAEPPLRQETPTRHRSRSATVAAM